MFTYTVEKINHLVQAFEGVFIWTGDKENQGILNRLFTPYNGEVSARQKPLNKMTCAPPQKDTLILTSNNSANLYAFLEKFESPKTITTLNIKNDATNPILVGMPEFLDILEAFPNISSIYIENCQNIFDPNSSIFVCEKITTLSLTNLTNMRKEHYELIAKLFPNLKTLIHNKCNTINHIDDTIELMIDLFSKAEIMVVDDTTYILDRV